MTVTLKDNLSERGVDHSTGILKVAIMAVGGQGGGVLSNWIADLADKGRYDVQMTSVAGVAQRTGATIYYIEMAPKSDLRPVFALAPSPGDVDILIASELMEAGRAVMRGFVTPDRTTLIASSHRVLAISEKQIPGDGRGESAVVHKSLEDAAQRLICFDMEALAQNVGSVVSASLFGGLARSKVLPFDTAQFEDVIRASGHGVEASLAAFHAALTYTETDSEDLPETSKLHVNGPHHMMDEWKRLLHRVEAMPAPAQSVLRAGLRKVVDYQDLAYGKDYLDRVDKMAPFDDASHGFLLTQAAAKYLANAMSYDDILRVPDLKTRTTRADRLRQEQEIGDGQIVHVTEYFHPRTEELVSILPVRIGLWAAKRGLAQKLLGTLAGEGKRIRSDRIGGFILIWLMGSLRPIRRRLLRHVAETAHLERLMGKALHFAPKDYDLAIEVLACQRLIKGYSDTHTRGQGKFDKIMNALDILAGRQDAAEWVRRLRTAALADEKGEALDGAIRTVRSFSNAS